MHLEAATDFGDELEERVLSNLVKRDAVLAEYAVQRGEARTPLMEDLVAGTQFEKRLLYRVQPNDHINVSETKSYAAEVRRISLNPEEHRKRRLYGLDSTVAIGAGSKGPSSSRRLNAPLRSIAPTMLLCRMDSGFGKPTECSESRGRSDARYPGPTCGGAASLGGTGGARRGASSDGGGVSSTSCSAGNAAWTITEREQDKNQLTIV